MPKLTVNDVSFNYEVQGDGEPLLLIAGFGCDNTIWTLLAPLLAPKHRLILFDNRGTGQTTGSEHVAGIRQLADDAFALLDGLKLEAVHIAGHSMGGMIAQELALAHPERVRSLTLITTCAKVDARNRTIIESWGELPRLVDPVMGARLSLPWIYTEAFFEKPGAIDEIMKLIAGSPLQPSPEAIRGQSRAIVSFNSLDRLASISCPTLVVAGREDILMPIHFSEALARGIPGAELVVLDKTGHGLPVESSEVLAAAMLTFLQRVPRRS